MELQRIAIVGAGLAGLVAAKELCAAGFGVEVFDKGRFTGGRLASRTRDNNQFDYGAQYFTVKDKRFAQATDSWLDAGLVAPWTARIVDIDELGIHKHPREHVRYVGVPDMRSPADALAGQLSSWKHRRVSFLNRLDSSLIELGFEDGGSEGPYDLVILNMPPKQCEPFLTALSSSLTEQVRSVEMTPCWALMLSFAEQLDVSFDAAFVSGDAPLSWIARDSSKPGRPPGERWVVHGSAEWSQAHLEDEAAAVEAALTDAFYRCLALSPDSAHSQTQGRLPEITFRKAHRWRYAIAVNPLEVGALVDVANKIAICGDWLVQNRVEGAFLSGLTCAAKVQQIFQWLKSPLSN